jgi:hypothetical protein
LAVNVPVTASDPVTGAVGQPAPTSDRSNVPLTVRHDDITVQAPATSPPQAVTLGQPPPAPALELPPAPVAPALPEPPPAPARLPAPALHPPEINATANAAARTADWTFIDGLLESIYLARLRSCC